MAKTLRSSLPLRRRWHAVECLLSRFWCFWSQRRFLTSDPIRRDLFLPRQVKLLLECSPEAETQRYVGILFTCVIITLSFTSFEVLLWAVPMGAVNHVRTSDSEFNETRFRSQVSIPACFFCFVFSVWSSVNCCNSSWRSRGSVCSLATLREVSELKW